MNENECVNEQTVKVIASAEFAWALASMIVL